MTGTCGRCGAVGPIEQDHPHGRFAGRPFDPQAVFPLCVSCHREKTRQDFRSRVVKAPKDSRTIAARIACWFAFLADGGRPIPLPEWARSDLWNISLGYARTREATTWLWGLETAGPDELRRIAEFFEADVCRGEPCHPGLDYYGWFL